MNWLSRKYKACRKLIVYRRRSCGWLLFIVAILLLIAAVYAATVHLVFGDMGKSGQFGDMFGFINAFVSSLALLGLVFSLRQQQKDLDLQRKEMRSQTEQYKRQVEIAEKAQTTQAFNGKFAILQQKRQELVYVSSDYAQKKQYQYGILAWKGLRNTTRSFIQIAQEQQEIEPPFKNQIDNQVEAYRSLMAWHAIFSTILYDLYLYEESELEKARSRKEQPPKHPAAVYMRPLLNSMGTEERELLQVCTCITANAYPSAKDINAFLARYMPSPRNDVAIEFRSLHPDHIFILHLKTLLG